MIGIILKESGNFQKIAETEDCDLEVVELAALLHDIADPKFHDGDETVALKVSREFLENQQTSENVIEKVLFIIKNISFKTGQKLLKISLLNSKLCRMQTELTP